MNPEQLHLSVTQWLHEPLFVLGDMPISVVTIVYFTIVLLLTIVVSRGVQSAIEKTLRFRGVGNAGTISAARRLVHYSVVLVGLSIALPLIGIKLTTLFAAGAVFAIGVGFAMQNIMQNFVSGVILLLERSIKPGDVLEVEGRFVRVRQMGIRATIARTLDDEEIIVPNSLIVQSMVKNYTLQDSVYRLRNTVGVSYDADMAVVHTTLMHAAQTFDNRILEREPQVLLIEFGDSAVVWEVSVWVDDPWRSRRVRSELNLAIWWALKDAKITIAYPQLDVHFHSALQVVDPMPTRKQLS